ncbi:hypothetical protein SLS54_009332 [Diplodia seriata]
MSINFYYEYQPLESDRHIRLLKIHHGAGPHWKGWKGRGPLFSLIHVSLDNAPKFEAVSYAWGSGQLVEKLPMAEGGAKHITKSVFEALPFLVNESETGLLWIDQLCINQDDSNEKGHQVKLMSQVYRSATLTLIWLGTEDRETRAPIELMEYIEEWRSWQTESIVGRIDDALDHPQGRAIIAKLGIRNLAAAISMIETLLSRRWFARGWVVQEFALSSHPVFVIGPYKLRWSSIFATIGTVPSDRSGGITTLMRPFHILIAQQFLAHASEKPKDYITQAFEFCRLLLTNAKLYSTKDLKDRIFAYMGIWLPPGFNINYDQNTVEAYIGFTSYLIEDTGFVDIIGAGHGLQRPVSEDLEMLPSWVPDFTGSTRLSTQLWRKHFHSPVGWNASATRSHQKSEKRAVSEVHAFGKLVDTIETASPMLDTNSDSLLDLYGTLQNVDNDCLSKSDFLELVTNAWNCGHWDREFSFEDLRAYFEACGSHDKLTNGDISVTSAEVWPHQKERDMRQYLGMVAKTYFNWCLEKTAGGKFCLSPPFAEPGDIIVILHGCRVPHILRKTEDPARFQMVGECYLQGAMRGEAVTWAEDEADLFILV